ncbi:MAG: T9SS type A sorting domain-containing protein, partial [Candidatus Cloacimonadaceae bacterium]|nr:T9SS type A sorting domain-containing protein [Candidatus Cloacimonadaceae bacterium]
VKIQFSADLGQNWSTIIESTPNNGSYTWQDIPVLDSQECLIRLSLLGSYHFDESTYPFGIVSTLAIPLPLYPLDNATAVPTNPLITWQSVPGATAYHLQLSQSQTFDSNLLDIDTHPQSSYQVSGLNPYSTYYWRVASFAGGVFSEFCPTLEFSTGEISEIPPVPNLVAPANNATSQSLTPLLSWTTVPQASSYWVQISQNGFFNNLVVESTDVTTNFWTPPALEKNSSYFWRVASTSPAGSSLFSNARRFSTGDGTDIPNDEAELAINKLRENYPNPFNPQTTIRLSVADTHTPLKVSVYNLKGQLIRKLFDGFPPSNSINLIWDSCDDKGNQVGSGIYLYHMEAGTYSKTRKMLLVK